MTDAASPIVPVGGNPVPDVKHLEQKELLERLAQANRDRQEDQKKFERQFQVQKTQAAVDIERLRATTAPHTRDLEAQVSALLKSLARLQADVERLERENLTLRVRGNGYAEPEAPSKIGVGTSPSKTGVGTSPSPGGQAT